MSPKGRQYGWTIGLGPKGEKKIVVGTRNRRVLPAEGGGDKPSRLGKDKKNPGLKRSQGRGGMISVKKVVICISDLGLFPDRGSTRFCGEVPTPKALSFPSVWLTAVVSLRTPYSVPCPFSFAVPPAEALQSAHWARKAVGHTNSFIGDPPIQPFVTLVQPSKQMAMLEVGVPAHLKCFCQVRPAWSGSCQKLAAGLSPPPPTTAAPAHGKRPRPPWGDTGGVLPATLSDSAWGNGAIQNATQKQQGIGSVGHYPLRGG